MQNAPCGAVSLFCLAAHRQGKKKGCHEDPSPERDSDGTFQHQRDERVRARSWDVRRREKFTPLSHGPDAARLDSRSSDGPQELLAQLEGTPIASSG